MAESARAVPVRAPSDGAVMVLLGKLRCDTGGVRACGDPGSIAVGHRAIPDRDGPTGGSVASIRPGCRINSGSVAGSTPQPQDDPAAADDPRAGRPPSSTTDR